MMRSEEIQVSPEHESQPATHPVPARPVAHPVSPGLAPERGDLLV